MAGGLSTVLRCQPAVCRFSLSPSTLYRPIKLIKVKGRRNQIVFVVIVAFVGGVFTIQQSKKMVCHLDWLGIEWSE